MARNSASYSGDYSDEESWVREWELSEACLFIPKGYFHLLLRIAIVVVNQG
jgi:hypothetical protein